MFSRGVFFIPIFRRCNMKLPNGYGGIVKLSGKRRKPYAVRTSYLQEQPDGTVKLKYKYLAYFQKRESALSYLAELNNGAVVPEHLKYASVLSFAELYDKWKSYRKSLKSAPSKGAWKNYGIAFDHFEDLHQHKIINIRAQDLQDCLNKYNHLSKSSIGNMRAIVRGMWKYALANDFVEKDITQSLHFEFTSSDKPIHTRFTDEEIKVLWNELYVINNVDIILIYIYTGLRPAELLDIKSENVHLTERYMIGGMKTDAGRNRIIPIHEKIVSLIENRLAQNRPYLITNKYGNHYSRAVYHANNWNTCMAKLNMHHSPHDTRYTFASLAENNGMNEICRKIIMGHSLSNKSGTAFKTGDRSDVTKGTYTEKTLADLIEAVNVIK